MPYLCLAAECLNMMGISSQRTKTKIFCKPFSPQLQHIAGDCSKFCWFIAASKKSGKCLPSALNAGKPDRRLYGGCCEDTQKPISSARSWMPKHYEWKKENTSCYKGYRIARRMGGGQDVLKNNYVAGKCLRAVCCLLCYKLCKPLQEMSEQDSDKAEPRRVKQLKLLFRPAVCAGKHSFSVRASVVTGINPNSLL